MRGAPERLQIQVRPGHPTVPYVRADAIDFEAEAVKALEGLLRMTLNGAVCQEDAACNLCTDLWANARKAAGWPAYVPDPDCEECFDKGEIVTGECKVAMSGPTCRNPACPPCQSPETEPCPECQPPPIKGSEVGQ